MRGGFPGLVDVRVTAVALLGVEGALFGRRLAGAGEFAFVRFVAELAGRSALAIASATAQGIREVAAAIQTGGGMEAVQLRVAEQYVAQFGQIARQTNTVVVPANVSDVAGMIAAAMKVFGAAGRENPPGR